MCICDCVCVCTLTGLPGSRPQESISATTDQNASRSLAIGCNP